MESGTVLTGNLSFLGLGDLLQLVGSNGGTGILRIISKYAAEPGLIYFDKGNIISASNALLEAKKRIGIDAVYSLFGWIEGEFEFSREDVQVQKIITTNRMEIILDGLRMVDDGVVPILGPVSFAKKTDAEKGPTIPIIKGPLVDYMYVVDEEEFYKGGSIAQENSHGAWVWVILEGVVDIIKETSQGPLTMLKIADGAFVGSMGAFLFQSTLRSFTAVAATNVQLGVLDSQRLSNDYAGRSREFRELALSLDKRLKEVTDKAVGVYLKKNNIKEFVKDKKPFKVEEDKLFSITQGQACIIRKTKNALIPLASLGMDDFIGRVPFLDIGHEPDGATVLVSEDFEVTELDIDSLQEEYKQLPLTLKNMIENVATCVSITTSSAVSFQKKKVPKKKNK
ncbi:DUF4388 domain-containing protein [Desulfobacterales bacterium HSG2]|nr:DUF4388 domain-containing protein [Desulfobacterales bacterium HSG2]